MAGGAAVLLAPRQGVQSLRDGARGPRARAFAACDEREPPIAHGRYGMSAAAWVAVGALLVAVGWLGLALVGAVREIGALRDQVDALEAGGAGAPTAYLQGGPAVRAPAPAWPISTPRAGAPSSSALGGRRPLPVFADATCRARDDPCRAGIAGAGRGTVPP